MSTPERFIKECFVLLEPITPKRTNEFTMELKRTLNERNILTTKTRKRVTDALDEMHVRTQRERNNLRKAKIVEEIHESEEKYVKQLDIIKTFFICPVQERALLKLEDFEALFGYINTIYNINKVLLEDLRKTKNVGGAFSKIAPFFKSYSFYAFEYKKCLEILQDCRKTNPKFAKFLEMQESRPEVQSKLSALLITPIQRVPRYKLLLTSLFNLTPPSDPNYGQLLDSLRKIEEAAEHINKIIKERENMQRLIELQRCLVDNQPSIITPGRSLLREGVLLQLSARGGPSKRTYLVLTNDIIMFCKMRKDEPRPNSLKCLGIYPLHKCHLVEVLDKGAFRLTCQDEEIVLYDASLAMTRQWVDALREAIESDLSDRRTLQKECSTRRPVKRKDLAEYHEVGLSPGRKLMKKRKAVEGPYNFNLTQRKPIRSECKTVSFSEQTKENCSVVSKVTNNVFVFGGENPDRGFSFKMNQFFSGIGSSVKKLFGFKS